MLLLSKEKEFGPCSCVPSTIGSVRPLSTCQSISLSSEVSEEHIMSIAEMVGVLHNASLMVDDIEDGSRLRRGVPVCHLIYGVPSTINTGNYMYEIIR